MMIILAIFLYGSAVNKNYVVLSCNFSPFFFLFIPYIFAIYEILFAMVKICGV
jgi:hypothetical protein